MSLQKTYLILICLMQIVFLLIFVWHIELSMVFDDNVYFDDGFRIKEPVKVYHIQLYVLLFFTILNSLNLLLLITKNATN